LTRWPFATLRWKFMRLYLLRIGFRPGVR
jgi:hypothetical protein